MNDFVQLEFVLFAVGVLATAAIALAQAWSKRLDKSTLKWSEPETSASVVVALLLISYLVNAALFRDLTTEQSIRVTITLSFVTIVGYIFWYLSAAVWRRVTASRVSDAEVAVKPELDRLQRLSTDSGVQDYFASINSPEFVRSLEEDLSRSTSVRVWCANVDRLYSGTTNPIGQLLGRRLSEGLSVRFVCGAIPSDVLPHNAMIILSPVELSEACIIECSLSYYLALDGAAGAPHNPTIRIPVGQDGNLLSSFARSFLDRAEEEARQEAQRGLVQVGKGPRLYRRRIIQVETAASRVDRIAKRIFVIFKDAATVQSIAKQRYGDGSSYLEGYVEEHRQRKQTFMDALRRGLICREIYSADELISYVTTRRHGDSAVLQSQDLAETLANWKEAIAKIPNYHVGITSERLPFHYELVDGSKVVLHEAIGHFEEDRVNSIFLESRTAAAAFQAEFDALWDRIPLTMRRNEDVIAWIETHVEPLLVPKLQGGPA